MKNLIYLFVLLLFSCEIYEEPSNPQLNLNGRWNVATISVWARSTYNGNPNREEYDRIPVTNSDMAVVGAFQIQRISEEENVIVLTQDFENAPIQRRFDLENTIWEFDYYDLIINDQFSFQKLSIDDQWCQYCTKPSKIEFFDQDKTLYTFSIDTYGAMPANVLVLTSQPFYTDIFLSNGQFDRAIECHLQITLHRF